MLGTPASLVKAVFKHKYEIQDAIDTVFKFNGKFLCSFLFQLT